MKHDQWQIVTLPRRQSQQRYQRRKHQQQDVAVSFAQQSLCESKRPSSSKSRYNPTSNDEVTVHSLNSDFTGPHTLLQQDEIRYKAGSPIRDSYIPRIAWIRHKGNVRQLYADGLTRRQILDIITEDFGDTKPTYAQLCVRLDRWGFYSRREGEKQNSSDCSRSDSLGKP